MAQTETYNRGRTIRTLYPDLPSAHAQIQGRRAASLAPESSSRSGTRFPLSSSSSSSEEDDFDALTLGSDAIPLSHLPCQNVPAAQAVLRRAGHHQESSAIFETSRDADNVYLGDSKDSALLDEILSQYATSIPSVAFPGCPAQLDFNVEPAQSHANSSAVREADVGTKADLDTQYGLSRECGGRGRSAEFAVTFAATDDDEGEWDTEPGSSRVGFLTPSKLRFRVTKRDTSSTSNSSLAGGKTPATPWDPLSTATHSNQRRRNYLHFHKIQTRPVPRSPGKGSASKGYSVTKATGSRRKSQRREQASVRSCSLTPVRTSATLPNLPGNEAGPSKPPFSSHLTSQEPSTRLSPVSSSHAVGSALPSSSLLPQVPNTKVLSKPFPLTAFSSSEDCIWPSRGTMSQEVNTSLDPCNEASTEPLPKRMANDQSVSANPELNLENLDGISMTTATPLVSQVTNPPLGPLFEKEEHQGHETTLLSQLLRSGDYTLSDNDISRFLRDSRNLRGTGETDRGPEPANVVFSTAGIRATGSSLANYSSDSTPLSRATELRPPPPDRDLRVGKGATEISGNVTHKFKRFLSGNSEANMSLDSSSGKCNTGTNSTSLSLLSAELTQHFSTPDAILVADRCPQFPLTPELLGVVRLPGMGRVPFERLQIWNSDEWFEKAWCFVHNRMEFSHAELMANEADIMANTSEIQRKAGRILLGLAVATYCFGGFVLAHSMGNGGDLSCSAMADMTRWISGHKAETIARVHPVDARLALAVEKAALWSLGVLLAGVVAVLVWAATL